MSILVTGAAGFIGTNFVRYWREHHADDHVVALDALTYAGVRDNLDGLGAYVRPRRHRRHRRRRWRARAACVDRVVNFAAESHNSLAVLDPARFFRTNVLGTQGLCEAARRVGVRRFHHVSTCEVYGDLDLETDERFTEASPYRPRTPYNASKAGGDHVVRAYYETWDLPVTITNCANNYGTYQFPEKVIPYFTTLALEDQPLPLYASTENRREWIHAIDHCRAIDAILERGRVGETYHVGTGVEQSIEQIADTILDHLGKPRSLKTIVPDRPGHDRRYVLDWSKINAELGWTPEIDWDGGIAATIDWYAGNRQWWQPLRDRAPVAEGTAWR